MAASSTTTRRRLEGKRALIYGGGTGLGMACAEAMLQEGAGVFITGRRRATLAEAAGRLGAFGRVGFAEGDAASEADVARVTGEAVAFLGGLDTLVVSAGRSSIGSIFDATPADFQAVMDTNLLGPFLAVRAAAPHLVEGAPASVILMASVVGVIAMRERVAYCTSKAGILGMTRALALDPGAGEGSCRDAEAPRRPAPRRPARAPGGRCRRRRLSRRRGQRLDDRPESGDRRRDVDRLTAL